MLFINFYVLEFERSWLLFDRLLDIFLLFFDFCLDSFGDFDYLIVGNFCSLNYRGIFKRWLYDEN